MPALAPTALGPPDGVRRGPRHWLGGYRTSVRWHLTSLRLWLATLTVVQVLAGVGFVLGIALFFRAIPRSAALYVATGVPVINLVLIGLVLGPQLVAGQKITGSYEYMRALPVPAAAAAFAWFTVTLAAGLPAVAISLAAGWLRYSLPLRPTWAMVPAILVISFTGTMLGYAIGHALPNPMVTQLLSQLLIFVVFGFAPIGFPASQMPSWLVTANWWFPFEHMGTVMRAALVPGYTAGVTSSYLILAVWAAACAALARWVLGRRG